MLVDQLWDLAHIPRAESLICDLGPSFPELAATIGDGRGVVASVQHRGGAPSAGGEGIWWWRDDIPSGFPFLGEGMRVRLMPLLEGVPCRVHGMVLNGRTAVFPPLELLSLPRPDRGTFLWAGAVPLGRTEPELEKAARRAGAFLDGAFAYRGPFAADGILTAYGFLPTELTTRLTSAFEGSDPFVRVMLHAATILARENADLPAIEELAAAALTSSRIDIYGLATRASEDASECSLAWAADGPHLSAQPVHGHMTLRPWVRGWQLHARLNLADLPGRPVGMYAPQLFALADKTFGTDFGTVTPPFGVTVPAPRLP
ncbi:hypothetical protein Acor_54870 [Acrocarpospora corrugata]|uniref:Uncharacterized protein n=1 Tax=Acrocarpospora corrugata TaxID=35763 RepID=A0A5M3W8J5_9ACTN|nr:hypothetical protein [Acrocarpospora corrugata]GES03421.1 hypothetical protein Acor_54870 [Acrocarpospora corrugata]